jgi:hypothetical protein
MPRLRTLTMKECAERATFLFAYPVPVQTVRRELQRAGVPLRPHPKHPRLLVVLERDWIHGDHKYAARNFDERRFPSVPKMYPAEIVAAIKAAGFKRSSVSVKRQMCASEGFGFQDRDGRWCIEADRFDLDSWITRPERGWRKNYRADNEATKPDANTLALIGLPTDGLEVERTRPNLYAQPPGAREGKPARADGFVRGRVSRNNKRDAEDLVAAGFTEYSDPAKIKFATEAANLLRKAGKLPKRKYVKYPKSTERKPG